MSRYQSKGKIPETFVHLYKLLEFTLISIRATQVMPPLRARHSISTGFNFLRFYPRIVLKMWR